MSHLSREEFLALSKEERAKITAARLKQLTTPKPQTAKLAAQHQAIIDKRMAMSEEITEDVQRQTDDPTYRRRKRLKINILYALKPVGVSGLTFSFLYRRFHGSNYGPVFDQALAELVAEERIGEFNTRSGKRGPVSKTYAYVPTDDEDPELNVVTIPEKDFPKEVLFDNLSVKARIMHIMSRDKDLAENTLKYKARSTDDAEFASAICELLSEGRLKQEKCITGREDHPCIQYHIEEESCPVAAGT